ncbi:MAG: EAL domain-containing protein [Propionivibrio sp.]|uniref:putative bifunctional diguanylate cyclase/phosphodiesterase n=1 Tax=Propionivibrio sp. TaxID=2212460 RepID=UPI001A4FD1F7|nr:bifunctional diguanylate cyclase/phosphodiesterase [Propionivibrio sp.]MBL8414238.1 EAL domain-containing protein [Propionivibrio sp.]
MPDSRVQRCLDLCSQAHDLGGEDLSRTLIELQQALRSLETDRPETAAETSPPAANLDRWQHEPVITMDMLGYLTGWNRGAEMLFGYTPDEAIGQHILFLYADEPDAHISKIFELFLDHGSPLMEVRRRKKSGETFRANMTLQHILDDNNEAVAMEAHLSEIADRLSPEEKHRLHARIIEDSEVGILITDASERIVSVNPAFSRITGYSAGEAIGETPDLLRSSVHGTDLRAKMHAAMHGADAWQGEIIGRRKNGDLFPQSVSIGVARNADGFVSHAFSMFSDISAIRAVEERMQQIVNFDSLTGLPNRNLFHQLVEQALAVARRNKDHCALLVIDLNRFNSVNDSLGHEVGDALLRQVGQRMRNVLRQEDMLARIGADEFVVALSSIQKREHSGLVAKKLLSCLEKPFVIGSHALHIGASIGIAIYPEDGLNAGALQRFADIAMQRVQRNNENGFRYYSPEMNLRAKEQWQLEGELRHALSGHQLILHYQPKVSLRSGRIVGAEALIRWYHPKRGMIPPDKFVPLAEETGLILELGSWILDEACHQIRIWLDSGLEPIPIAVNISARQFDNQLPERLQATIERHHLPCELLKLEITESLLVRGPEKVIPIMNELVALGFNLSLDDFGTGYSSLAYLKKFPITTLKIDRSFVVGVPDDENDCAIAQAIVTMGKQLRQEIVAEGVETLAQMSFLRGLGCDQLQGYLFSPPIAAEEFERLVREGRRLSLD